MINIWNFGRFMSGVDMTVNPIAWWIALGLIFFAQYSNFILYGTFRRYPCYFPFRLTVEWGTVGTVLNWGIKCSSNSFFGAHNGLLRIYTSWGVYGALNFRFSNFIDIFWSSRVKSVAMCEEVHCTCQHIYIYDIPVIPFGVVALWWGI